MLPVFIFPIMKKELKHKLLCSPLSLVSARHLRLIASFFCCCLPAGQRRESVDNKATCCADICCADQQTAAAKRRYWEAARTSQRAQAQRRLQSRTSINQPQWYLWKCRQQEWSITQFHFSPSCCVTSRQRGTSCSTSSASGPTGDLKGSFRSLGEYFNSVC